MQLLLGEKCILDWMFVSADSPSSVKSGKGNFASADAARVGGGLYGHVLEALCTLATDPAPIVSKMGKAVLLTAGVQLMHVTQSLGNHSG